MKKKKILVVDDEIDFLDFIKLRLEANNYEIVTSGDGKSALGLYKRERPDAVLLYILMPEIDGLSVLKRLREMDERLPIFIITAFSNEERMQEATRLNANGYILKTNNLQDEIGKITATIEVAEQYKKKSRK